ncbi:unnamed protein product [Paramecium octaurelia]|uniref:Uncharacterized protein n=1 Tax=Paramecium octaurelia TaxID=43137 RepID=A0A8S1W2U4_PAROT|nr:unnamed protein product [Paramecium octaurelia]
MRQTRVSSISHNYVEKFAQPSKKNTQMPNNQFCYQFNQSCLQIQIVIAIIKTSKKRKILWKNFWISILSQGLLITLSNKKKVRNFEMMVQSRQMKKQRRRRREINNPRRLVSSLFLQLGLKEFFTDDSRGLLNRLKLIQALDYKIPEKDSFDRKIYRANCLKGDLGKGKYFLNPKCCFFSKK